MNDPTLVVLALLLGALALLDVRGCVALLAEALVAKRIEGRFLGLFGEPRVNVLLLNLDLRALRPPARSGTTPR